VGALVASLPSLKLHAVEDPRSRQGRRWKLSTLLTAILTGLVADRRSLAQLETLVEEMSSAARSVLKLPTKLADTTVRDVLVRLSPFELRQVLHRMVKAALRGGKLALTGFPFHVLVLDGKATAIPNWDNHYSQRKTYDDGRKAHGTVRTVTAMLASCRAKPVVDAIPIPAETNEMGIFPFVFEALCRVYGSLFQLVTYDAGANSLANARLVAEAGKHYLFRLKDEARFLMKRAIHCVGPTSGEVVRATTEDTLSDKSTVRRTLYVRQAKKGFKDWGHLRTVLRVRSETFDKTGKLLSTLDRYFISNLPHAQLSWEQWLALVRCHWAVENNGHWTLDAIFQEDSHPWIEASPKGTLAMMLLRRIAYNITSCFRSVTQRSEEKRQTPWRSLLRWFYNAFIAATAEQLEGLRSREAAVVAS
jgi:predicted transposase YbfD/YdcC